MVMVVVVQGELCGTETAAANTMIDLDPSSVEKRVQCTRLCFRIQRYWRLNVHGYWENTWRHLKKKPFWNGSGLGTDDFLDKRKDVLYKTSPKCSSSTFKVPGNYLRFSFAMNDWDKETNWKLKKISCLNHRASRTNVFFLLFLIFRIINLLLTNHFFDVTRRCRLCNLKSTQS